MPIIILGTIGNLLTIVVLCRRRLRRIPTSLYLIVLAVVDTLFLYLEIFHSWYLGYTGVFLRSTTLPACQIMRFLLVTAQWSSAWIIVAVTLQRLLAVCMPLKAYLMNTVKSSAVGVFIILTISTSVSSHFFWTYGSTSNIKNNVTIVKECDRIHPYFLFKVWPVVEMVVNTILPFLLLFVFNSIIIYQVRKRRQILDHPIRDNSRNRNRSASVTIMVLTLSFSFLILTLPIRIHFAGRSYWNPSNDPHTKQKLRLFYAIASMIQGINHAANFIFYCLSGRSFRAELAAMLFCRRGDANSQYELSSRGGQRTSTAIGQSISTRTRYDIRVLRHVQMSGSVVQATKKGGKYVTYNFNHTSRLSKSVDSRQDSNVLLSRYSKRYDDNL